MAQKPAKKTAKFPLAIREDGMLYVGTPKVLRLPQYRPYHGDPYATKEERLAWLRGERPDEVSKAQIDAELGAFDLGKADKAEILEFVLNETGQKLDSRKSLEKLRAEAAALLADTNTAGA